MLPFVTYHMTLPSSTIGWQSDRFAEMLPVPLPARRLPRPSKNASFTVFPEFSSHMSTNSSSEIFTR